MKDLRFVELDKRQDMTFGVREMVVTILGGGILLIIGMYAYSKIGSSVESGMLNGGVYHNTTHYCSYPAGYNGTNCTGGTWTAYPDYGAVASLRNNVKPNITSGMDLSSVSIIVLAAAGIIGILYLAFR